MPQPVDMQSELNRSAMAERIQEASTRASLAAQHRAHLDVEEEDRARETKVNEAEETSRSEIDKDGRRREGLSAGKKKKRRKSVGSESSHVLYTFRESKEIVEDPDDHMLDVTI